MYIGMGLLPPNYAYRLAKYDYMYFSKIYGRQNTLFVGNCDSKFHLHCMTWDEIEVEKIRKFIVTSGRRVSTVGQYICKCVKLSLKFRRYHAAAPFYRAMRESNLCPETI